MASRIKGITVEIGGDTTGLQNALKQVNSSIKSTQSALKDVNKLLKLDPTNTELLSQKQKLLKDVISATSEKLQSLKTAQEQAKAQLENGILGQDKYDALLQKTYTVDFLNKKRVANNDIFRRINWNNRGHKSTVWRCLSRVGKDRPSCTARTVKEQLLHEVVVRAVNELIRSSDSFLPALQSSSERCLSDSNSRAGAEINARLLELQQELLKLANAKQNYDALADEIGELRAEKEELLLQEANKDGLRQRMADMVDYLKTEPEEVTEYSEILVRRMIEKITVYDDHFVVEFKSGIEITINE